VTVIDSHIHLWRLARGDNLALTPAMVPIYRDIEPADLKPLIDAAGVDKVVVVQAAWTLAETLFTIGLSARHPWIAGIVGWADLTSPSLAEELDALKLTGKLKGIRPVDKGDNVDIAWLLDPGLERGYRALAEADLSLDILVQDPGQLPVATELARRLPDLAIVLDHCAKPGIAGGGFRPWAEDIAAFAALPHTVCKLSGIPNQARRGAPAADFRPYAAHVLDVFGPRRVMWGSDWPVLELASDYASWKGISDEVLSGLSPGEREEVYCGTATRIYRL
jgi:L-fuconolactonase